MSKVPVNLRFEANEAILWLIDDYEKTEDKKQSIIIQEELSQMTDQYAEIADRDVLDIAEKVLTTGKR